MLDVLGRSLGACDSLVAEDQQLRILTVHAVDVFQRTIGRLRIEEIDDRNKSTIKQSLDDVELPLKALDTGRGDFHNYFLVKEIHFERG
jgi:hypothetical protein